MNNLQYLLLATFFTACLFGCAHANKRPVIDVDKDILFQYSTLNSLIEGVYDGDMTFGKLKTHGDFGLGTVNRLDGELVFLDRKFYQIKSTGEVYKLNNGQKTPFAVVTFFEPDKSISPDRQMDWIN